MHVKWNKGLDIVKVSFSISVFTISVAHCNFTIMLCSRDVRSIINLTLELVFGI